ncbi:hypothetical protein [Paraburkholderia sp. BR10882]|uniref:hypothetical protein n=1 Tax=unclassified Paraburkholderia TaxID=2615204 RepID=UPI0034CF8A90
MDNATEFFEERTAIMQFDGGIDPVDARYYAMVLTRLYCQQHKLTEPDLQYFKAFTNCTLHWSDERSTVIYTRG